MKPSTASVTGAILVALFPIFPLASENTGTFRLGCPPVWPGMPSEKLSYANEWVDLEYEIGPGRNIQNSEGEVELDCAYGKEAGQSFRRITVVLPKEPLRCAGPRDGKIMRYCEFTMSPEGGIGPVSWYIAEPITLSTRLLGFGLRMTTDQISAQASSSGFSCAREDNGENMLCKRAIDLVSMTFKQGKTSEINWTHNIDKSSKGEFYRSVILRFGLERDYKDWPETEAWPLVVRPHPFKLTLTQNESSMSIRLYDLAASAR